MKTISAMVLFGLLISQFAVAGENPELKLVEGLIATSGLDTSTANGREQYQRELGELVRTYSAEHTTDEAEMKANLGAAFKTLHVYVSNTEMAQIQGASANLAQALVTGGDRENSWKQYGTEVSTALQGAHGAQYDACQVSVRVMAVGLGVGLPLTIYTIGKAMGDQSVPSFVSGLGGIAFLAGIGGLIATLPTCW